MALFNTPEKHAANPPATWQVVKVTNRRWDLMVDDGVIQSFATKREAEEHKTTGPWVRLYEDEGRWYAGESVRGWKPYKPTTKDTPAADLRVGDVVGFNVDSVAWPGDRVTGWSGVATAPPSNDGGRTVTFANGHRAWIGDAIRVVTRAATV